MIGDMAFSGGFETMLAGKDTEGWMQMVQVLLSSSVESHSKRSLIA